MNRRPNIVYLLNDHQLYYKHGQDMGVHIQRPSFDKFALEGINFQRAYSVSPLCGPARRSMLTGLYPHNHGEIKNDINHPFDTEVYLDVLAENGYQNYYYGKWHAGEGTAIDHQCEGFSYSSYNNPYTKPEYKEYLKNNNLPEPTIKIEHNFTTWMDGIQEGETYKQDKAWCNEHASGIMQSPKETHEAFFLADLACQKLKELSEKGTDQPFSIRVDFWGPHQPYFPTQEFADLYDPKDIPIYPSFDEDVYNNNKPEIYQSEGNAMIGKDDKLVYPNPLSWSIWQKVIARAYAQITLVDAAAGKILDALNEYGFDDNTIVIWTTDHGDALASHGGHFDKRSCLTEEMVRIPMAIRYPNVIPAGQVSNDLVGNLDVAPTMLDAVGLSFEKEVDGLSLLPISIGETNKSREYIVCETHGHMEDHIGRAVITDRYKYVYNQNQIDELYDLCIDPYELDNLSGNPRYTDIENKLKAYLAEWVDKTNDPYCK